MKDILRPILELLVVLPGLLLGYFPVKTYLKQSPGRLAAWLFPLMACLCIGSGLACYRLHASTVFALAGVALAAICLYTRTLTISLWKSGTIALAVCAVYSVVLSDILGDPLDMIASGPACPDSSTCAQAAAIAEKYRLALSPAAAALLRQETPKTLPNVTTKITGSVRELCRAAADACRAEGYEPVLLTDCLCCEAREAGSLLGSIARTHAGQGRRRAFIAGGETVVHLTGHGLGGRNQELALAAAPALAGLRGCCVFSVGSDGTDGPTDAAGGYADGEALAALTAAGLDVPRALADNDAYHALQAVGGLIMTGPTGTNVNDVAVVLTE